MYRLGIEFSFFFHLYIIGAGSEKEFSFFCLLYILEPDLKRKVEAWGGWKGFGQE